MDPITAVVIVVVTLIAALTVVTAVGLRAATIAAKAQALDTEAAVREGRPQL